MIKCTAPPTVGAQYSQGSSHISQLPVHLPIATIVRGPVPNMTACKRTPLTLRNMVTFLPQPVWIPPFHHISKSMMEVNYECNCDVLLVSDRLVSGRRAQSPTGDFTRG